MPICLKCGKRSDCKEICKEVEVLLRKETKGRPKWETLVDPRWLDTYSIEGKVLIRGKNKKGKEEALYVLSGGRKKPHILEE